MNSTPPFTLQSLPQTCAANRELVEKILANFRRQLIDDLNKISRCVENKDATGTEQWAHALTRAAGSVTADPLRALAAQLEFLAREGTLALAENQITELRNEVERCIAHIPIAINGIKAQMDQA